MENKRAADWRISDIWNNLVIEDYPVKPRDYIRASEIGKPFLDRYLAMKGVPHSNPFPPRIKRVFDAGFIFEVDVVERLFKLIGILQDSQKEVILELPGMLKIIGHFDHKVGGKINFEQAQKEIGDPHTSQWMKERALKLLEVMIDHYPNGMKTLIADIKTVNSRSFWYAGNQDPETGFFKGYDHHKLQLYTYLLAENEPEGRLFYISKDDLTLMESPVSLNNQILKEIWEKDIAQMTHYYKNNIEPPKEDDLVFSDRKQMWEYNWTIMRSSYFTHITGFDNVDDWQNSLRDELKNKNTVPCILCQKPFSLLTLNKNKGYCARCAKKEGGEINNGK